MTTAKRMKGTAVSMPVGIAMGVSVSLVITTVLASLLTWLALSGKIEVNTVGYYSMGIMIVSALCGPLVSAVKIKRRWLMVCCITGMVYFLGLLAATALFFGGNYKGVGISAIMVIIGTLSAGALGLKRKAGPGRRYIKYRSG